MDELTELIKTNYPRINSDLIKKAIDFATAAHYGQKRLSGDPYVSHPLAVAEILAGWRMDEESIIVALLHDTVEEGAATTEDIKKTFGERITTLVDGITVIGQIKLRGSDEEELVEGLRKMFLVMAKDIRVVVVKLADRLHNMRTLKFHLPEKQKSVAKETLEIYAPLAERLGMGQVKAELEDLAFPVLFPKEYVWVKKISAPYFQSAQKDVVQAKAAIKKSLADEGVNCEIFSRIKHLYSLYRKLLRPEINREISRVNDLLAIRVLVDTVEHCYVTLGIVHKIFRPLPNVGISDFIAVPKPNGYRSIHTKVFGPSGKIIEIQIRTFKMHEEAEYGLASHIYYASLKAKGASDADLESGKIAFAPLEKLSWIRQLANWQKEITDSKEFLQTLKLEGLSERIFILTPKGDVKDLPKGSTPIDFAYAIHTSLGDRTVGAKINGKIVSLSYQLKSGDVCEIMLSKEPRKPKEGWLDFVFTRLAKKEIQKGLRAPLK